MKRSKARWLILAAALLLAGSGGLAWQAAHLASLRTEQFAAEDWQGEGTMAYALHSAFLTEDAALTPSQLYGIRSQVDTALRTASLEASETARLWCDAYSADVGTLTLTGVHTAEAAVTAVGGSFFTLHDLPLLDGGYLSEDDLMEDVVVLDAQLAWRLYGSSDVAGMELTHGDRTYRVLGVVEMQADSAAELTYGNLSRMYVHYAACELLTGETPYITCYEAILPDPVRNFAETTWETTMQFLPEGTCELLTNTDRYSLPRTWETLTDLRHLPIRQGNIAYPHWENAARVTALDRCFLLLGSAGLLGISLLCLVMLGIILRKEHPHETHPPRPLRTRLTQLLHRLRQKRT